jgi:hypothetical protein
MHGPNGNSMGLPPLTPELATRLQSAQVAQQRQIMEAMVHVEMPLVLVNRVYSEVLGPLGVKLVFGETIGDIPNAPMKPRASICLPWSVVRSLVEGLAAAEKQAGMQ